MTNSALPATTRMSPCRHTLCCFTLSLTGWQAQASRSTARSCPPLRSSAAFPPATSRTTGLYRQR